ncbi:MAG TPA: carboxypeptidase-like regulatory domain-containing protein [Bacteroidales bacterium]|nr:carboxypeptidase-like regulatory domain-containing protein [Bacteroidales bacterium]
MRTLWLPVTFILLALLMMETQAFSQEFQTINGIVRDSRTRRPIPFASIFVPGSTVGTVANLNGVFTLKIQKDLEASEFGISHLGYHRALFNILENTGTGKVFFLDPHSVTLPEVVVRPENPRELVRAAIRKIPENFPDEPQRLIGFYREAIKERRDYVTIAEAVVEIDQTAYGTHGGRDRTRILQARKSGDVMEMDTLIVKLQGGPHVAMLLDLVKNPNVILDPEMLEKYNFELVDYVNIEGNPNYVIEFSPDAIMPFALYYGRIYIDINSLGITMVEFRLDLSDREKAVENFVVRKPPRLRFTPTRTNYLVTYKLIDGRFNLNYVRVEVEFFADWRRRLFRTGYTLMSEMAITERLPAGEQRIAIRDTFRPTNILSELVPVYFDEEFWGAYNVIEPEESIDLAIQRFNKRFEE